MRSPRLSLAVTALCVLSALSACSNGGGDPNDNPKSEETPTAASESPTVYPVGGCQATVRVTGALKVNWTGDGMVTPSGDATVYQSSNNKSSWVAITTEAGDSPASVVVTVKGTTYPVPAESVKVEESADELSATATADVAKGKKAQVNANFTCKGTAD